MPLKRCQENNQQGWKWGDEGKCYIGPDAKEKALKQGRAIGEYSEVLEKIFHYNELLKRIKVGFDYDGTITQSSIRKIIQKLITDGSTEIYVITSRDSALSLYPILTQLGIPNYRVYPMGSNEEKIKKVKQLGLDKFYDNNKDVIDQLPGVGVLV